MRKRSGQERPSTNGSGRLPKKVAELNHQAAQHGLAFLKMELDLSFTFITLAITAYASGSLAHARQAARDAQKGYHGAKKQFAKTKMSPKTREELNQRLNNLEQALTTLQAKDPEAFGNHDHSGREQATSTPSRVSRPK